MSKPKIKLCGFGRAFRRFLPDLLSSKQLSRGDSRLVEGVGLLFSNIGSLTQIE